MINKFLIALAGLLGVLAAALKDGHLDNAELGAVVSAAVAALLVFLVPNRPTRRRAAPPEA